MTTTMTTDAPATVVVPTRRKPARTPARRKALRLVRRIPVWLLVAAVISPVVPGRLRPLRRRRPRDPSSGCP